MSHRQDNSSSTELTGDLSTCIEYQALSYCCGNGDKSYRTSVNAQHFMITADLAEALLCIRHAEEVTTLWIDAISINQQDNAEKGEQISQMDSVFKHALLVVSWLGNDSQNGPLGLHFAELLFSHAPQASKEESNDLHMRELLEPTMRRFLCSKYAREWLAFHRIFQRPFWGRAWILQEVILAKRLLFVCGRKAIAWPVMRLALPLFSLYSLRIVETVNSSLPIENQGCPFPATAEDPYSPSSIPIVLVSAIYTARRYWTIGSAAQSSLDVSLLNSIRSRSSKLAHDKVYSILGLLGPNVTSQIPPPNYNQSECSLFKQLAKAYILGNNSLEILRYSDHVDSQDDLPSWVVDLRRENHFSTTGRI